MRRTIYASILVVATLAAVGAYWLARRPMVVGRAHIGSPPPQVQTHENLIGQSAPVFDGIDQNGRRVGTATLRGRVVVVNVWAPWCRPCVQELPRVEREIWRRFQPRLAVVGIALGERPESVRDFNRRTNLTFSLIADPRRDISRLFGAGNAIPQSFVIDRAGRVVYQTLGYDERSFGHLVTAVEKAIAREALNKSGGAALRAPPRQMRAGATQAMRDIVEERRRRR